MIDEDDPRADDPREDGWDRRCAQVIALAMDHGFGRLVAGLGAVRADRGPDGVRACVVGGFGTGRTHLINQLAGSYALDEAPAAVPRAVRAARTGREPDGSASLDNSWLREAGLELVDTPGLWGDDGREAAEAVSAALGADAVVLTVRAVGGADLQERGLLARLAAQPGGTVLLVVTMLDEVTGDRDAVMERYRRIAEAAGGTVEVFAGPGGDLVRPRWPGNLDALRARLTDLGAASGRRRTRDRRISAALSTVCDELEALADEALAPGGTGEARRTGDLEHRASLARWSVVRLEVSAERDRLRAQVVARVSALQTEILDEVEQRVAEHTDPKALWLDELAGELHSRMTGRIDEDESIIGAAFRRDVLRVAAELDAIAGPRPHLEVTGPAAAGDPALADGSGAFAEAAGRMRVFSAATIDTLGGLAGEAGALLTELLFGAVVPADALPLPRLLGDVVQPRVGGRLIERQRSAVRDAARLVLAGYVAESVRRGDDRIGDLYERLMEAGEERLDAWWAARLAVWDRPEREAADWRRLRAEARHLRAEITKAADRTAHDDEDGEPWNPPAGSRTGRAGEPG
ncbi:GTPase domain-containing protein [Actinomadura xylanilytica]|uniref:GTPase domain-containing protein n=1 Tax=Actinomadura xylanilytica TaxID=887459 RepID=UPI00255B076E|nr:GTPase domain-containing protein [Actinomadura xylanilytica]MDL4772504.1 GTPase domain-containing protein [Actinomadura xylanilytica]